MHQVIEAMERAGLIPNSDPQDWEDRSIAARRLTSHLIVTTPQAIRAPELPSESVLSSSGFGRQKIRGLALAHSLDMKTIFA